MVHIIHTATLTISSILKQPITEQDQQIILPTIISVHLLLFLQFLLLELGRFG